MEFLLFSIYYLYNYYMVCVLLSYTHHVTFPSCDVTLSHTPSCVVKKRERKEKKYK